MMMQNFLNVFVSLLVTVNPLAVSSVFVGLMAQAAPREMQATAFKAVATAFFILLFFAFFGEAVLTGLGIRLPSFHIAGGLLLFVIAFRMLFGDGRQPTPPHDSKFFVDRADVAVFPLGIPMIAGPGCMTVMILIMSRTKDHWDVIVAMAALVAVMVTTLGCLLAARTLLRVIGASGQLIISRVMGVLLAARSVQFIVDGIRDIHAMFFAAPL